MNIRDLNKRYMIGVAPEIMRVRPAGGHPISVTCDLLSPYISQVHRDPKQQVVFQNYYWPTAPNCWGTRLVLLKYERGKIVFITDSFVHKKAIVKIIQQRWKDTTEDQVRTIVELFLSKNIETMFKEN